MYTVNVGTGRSIITPPLELPHAGWGSQDHDRATAHHMDFLATAMVFGSDDDRILLVDLDLGLLSNSDAVRYQQELALLAQTTPDRVRVSYTHTHAGAALPSHTRHNDGDSDSLVEDYQESILEGAKQATREAVDNLQPGLLNVGIGTSDITVNRRIKLPSGRVVVGPNPSGFRDTTVSVIRVDTPGGEPLAAVVGYSSHPTSLGPQNRLMSPDYPGVFRREFEHITGTTCLFLQGCAGNLMTRQGFTDRVEVCEALGKRLAVDAAGCFMSIETVQFEMEVTDVIESGAPLAVMTSTRQEPAETTLRASTRSVALPVRDLQAQPPDSEASTPDRFESKRRRMLGFWEQLCEGKSELSVEVQALGVGPVVLVGFPGEPFAELGVRVREGHERDLVFLSGYTNGWNGYLPTDEAMAEGGYAIEIASPFGPGAETELIKAIDELVQEVALNDELTTDGTTG